MNTTWKALPAGAWGLLGLLTVVASPLHAQTATTTTTTTEAVPAPAPPPPPVTTVRQTTVTTVTATKLYLRKGYDGDIRSGSQLYVRTDGKVYTAENEYVGHLTNLSGSDIDAIRDEFKIRSPGGTVIASTRPSKAFDSDRKITLAPKAVVEPAATTTTTTQQTTTTAP